MLNRVCCTSIGCIPGKTALGSRGCEGCHAAGAPADPAPGGPAWLPSPLRVCAPSCLPAGPTVSEKKAGPHDVYFINCFLYVYLGCPMPSPQNSKYTFKNEQAINRNNIHNIQKGRQEVSDEIKDIHGGS